MLLAFNLLFWCGHFTDEHVPLLATLKKVGYDGVELPIFEGSPEHYRKVGRRIRDHGLRCTAVTVMPDPARDCASADPAVRAAALDYIKWAIDCLEAAGGEVLCGPFHQPLGVFSGDPPTPDERSHVAEVHRQAAAYAGERGIKLSIEAAQRFECYVLNTVADAADLVREVGAPNYGLLYDTFHANIEEKDPVGVIAPHLDRINHVHLSENDRGTPGKGHVPWARDVDGAETGGYQGWFAIEAFGRALPALAAATRVWRDFAPTREEVYRFGHDFLREQWDRA